MVRRVTMMATARWVTTINEDGNGATGNEVDDDGNDDDCGATYFVRLRQATTTMTSMATARRATKSTMMVTVQRIGAVTFSKDLFTSSTRGESE